MSGNHIRVHGSRWTVTRHVVFERDRWRCRSCGRAGRLECDHVTPLQMGGDPYDPSNLQTLCRTCHIAKTRRENRRPLTPAEARWRELVAAITQEPLPS